MIPTPDLSHLTSQDYAHIYEPCEDTFLLLDALEADANVIRQLQPRICLEIGSGSGCVTTLLAKIVGESNAVFFTTDINPDACNATMRTAQKNGVNQVEAVRTSLTEALLPRLAGCIDVMCFNPPYVVTPPEEIRGFGIEASWAGGVDGRQVIDAFLPSVKTLLSPHGLFYLLLISENRPNEVVELMRQEHGMVADIFLQRRAGIERQYILKIQRSE